MGSPVHGKPVLKEPASPGAAIRKNPAAKRTYLSTRQGAGLNENSQESSLEAVAGSTSIPNSTAVDSAFRHPIEVPAKDTRPFATIPGEWNGDAGPGRRTDTIRCRCFSDPAAGFTVFPIRPAKRAEHVRHFLINGHPVSRTPATTSFPQQRRSRSNAVPTTSSSQQRRESSPGGDRTTKYSGITF